MLYRAEQDQCRGFPGAGRADLRGGPRRNFQVNEAWIAFKLNDVPIKTERDGDFNVIALMDAASCFIMGSEFVPAEHAELSESAVKRLLETGYSHRRQFAKTLFIPTEQQADILSAAAEHQGITVVRVPGEDIQLFLGEVRESFREYFGSGSWE